MDFLFGSKITASVDIGHYGLKWAAIDRRKGTCHAWNGDIWPERASRKETLDDNALAGRLQKLVAECQKAVPVWNKKVACSAMGSKVFYGYVEFGKTSTKFLSQAVTSSILNSLPFPLDELQLQVVGVESLSGRPDRSAAFYTLLHKSYIERLRQLVAACGLTLDCAVPVPVALAKAWGKNRAASLTEFVALVHVGFDKTLVVAAKAEQPYYVREVPVAGAQFTYSFQVEEHGSWQVAEEHKRAYDVNANREHFVEPDLRKWLDEVKRSINHFESKYLENSVKISRVVLSGGGACWAGLDKRLAEALQLPVLVDGWGDIRPVEPRPDTEALLHKVSIGSCLR